MCVMTKQKDDQLNSICARSERGINDTNAARMIYERGMFLCVIKVMLSLCFPSLSLCLCVVLVLVVFLFIMYSRFARSFSLLYARIKPNSGFAAPI